MAAEATKPVAADDLDVWEGKFEQQVVNDASVPETDRTAIIYEPARGNAFSRIE
jgi:hypothetical protein